MAGAARAQQPRRSQVVVLPLPGCQPRPTTRWGPTANLDGCHLSHPPGPTSNTPHLRPFLFYFCERSPWVHQRMATPLTHPAPHPTPAHLDPLSQATPQRRSVSSAQSRVIRNRQKHWTAAVGPPSGHLRPWAGRGATFQRFQRHPRGVVSRGGRGVRDGHIRSGAVPLRARRQLGENLSISRWFASLQKIQVAGWNEKVT